MINYHLLVPKVHIKHNTTVIVISVKKNAFFLGKKKRKKTEKMGKRFHPLNSLSTMQFQCQMDELGGACITRLHKKTPKQLNVLFTRELPQLTNQLQYTIEQMNQLIQRQLDN